MPVGPNASPYSKPNAAATRPPATGNGHSGRTRSRRAACDPRSSRPSAASRRPWPTSPNIIPNMNTNDAAAKGVGSISRVARGAVGVDQRAEGTRQPARPQQRRRLHQRGPRAARSRPPRPPPTARSRAGRSSLGTHARRAAKAPRRTAASARRVSSTSPASRSRRPSRSICSTPSSGLGEAWLGRLAPRAARARGDEAHRPPRPAGRGSGPTSCTEPESAMTTSIARSRSAGAISATRLIGDGKRWSGNLVEDLDARRACRRAPRTRARPPCARHRLPAARRCRRPSARP